MSAAENGAAMPLKALGRLAEGKGGDRDREWLLAAINQVKAGVPLAEAFGWQGQVRITVAERNAKMRDLAREPRYSSLTPWKASQRIADDLRWCNRARPGSSIRDEKIFQIFERCGKRIPLSVGKIYEICFRSDACLGSKSARISAGNRRPG